uniref:Uncharacterized protein n=1 Tax=Romanomermis culicivorax TaxID=13658 RepID=A0A915HM73_ROMCU
MASKVSSNGAKYLHGPQPTKEDIFLAALASSSTTTRATNPDHNAHYTCFCGLMHVSTGAAIGAVLEILICMFYLTLTILKFGDTHNYIGSRTLNTIVVGITILLDIGLICGIKFSKPWLFVVHVIWHSLLLVLMSLLTVSLGMQFHEYYNSYTQRKEQYELEYCLFTGIANDSSDVDHDGHFAYDRQKFLHTQRQKWSIKH